MQHFPPRSTPLSAAQANAGHCCILFSEGPPAHLLQLAPALSVHRVGGCLLQQLFLALSSRSWLVLSHRPVELSIARLWRLFCRCLLQQLLLTLSAPRSRLVLAHSPAQRKKRGCRSFSSACLLQQNVLSPAATRRWLVLAHSPACTTQKKKREKKRETLRPWACIEGQPRPCLAQDTMPGVRARTPRDHERRVPFPSN